MNIKNLTNSPYPITLANGEKTIIPARGSLEGVELRDYDLALLRACGYIEISESAPVDEQADPRDALRTEYAELSGENADKRWSESRLRSEIAEMGALQ